MAVTGPFPFSLNGTMDLAVAVVAGLLVAGVAFRRARGVLTPEARQEAARQSRRARARQAVTTLLAAARAGVGIAALVGIVWLARQLFA